MTTTQRIARQAIIFLAILSGAAVASDVPLNKGSIDHLVARLQALHDAGVKIGRGGDVNELRACVSTNGHLRDEAFALRHVAQALPRLAYRMNLTMAADHAAACLYCAGSGLTCPKIPPILTNVKKHLRAEGD